MILPNYNKEQVGIYKGIGIIMIVMHNYYHLLKPNLGESEFIYRGDILVKYYDYFIVNVSDFAALLFSYFGHFGVQIFIFFSAYGLTKKYYQGSRIDYWGFLYKRLLKIYPTFLIAVIAYLLIGYVKSLVLGNEYDQRWDSVLYKLLLISNFIPDQALKPVGPWWFLPFIFTLYIVFPFILAGYKKFGVNFLLILSSAGILLEVILNPIISGRGLSLNYLVIGYMPLISLGIYFASKERVVILSWQIYIAFIVFVLGNFNQFVWILSGSSLMILMLVIGEKLSPMISNGGLFFRVMLFYGGISFHLFLVNGFLRHPFLEIAKKNQTWIIDNTFALVSFLVVTIAAVIFKIFDNSLQQYIYNKTSKAR